MGCVFWQNLIEVPLPVERRTESFLVSEWADCIAGQFLLDLIPSVQSHKRLYLGNSCQRDQAWKLCIKKPNICAERSRKSASFYPAWICIGLWEPWGNFPSFSKRLNISWQSPIQREKDKGNAPKDVAWISVQTCSRIKPSATECEIEMGIQALAAGDFTAVAKIHLVVQTSDLGAVTNSTSWESLQHQHYEIPVAQFPSGVISL